MKNILFVTLIFGLFSCKDNSLKSSMNENQNKKEDNVLVSIDSFYIDENEIDGGSEYKEYSYCDFSKELNDDNISPFIKAIYSDDMFELDNEIETLKLIRKLNIDIEELNQFYFKVITKIYENSDGVIAEQLGYSGKEFVSTNTNRFISFFDNDTCFTRQDLETWVEIVMLEIDLIAFNEFHPQLMSDFQSKLDSNCIACSESQKNNLQSFKDLLDEKWEKIINEQ